MMGKASVFLRKGALRATSGDRISVDPLSIELAAGTLTGDAAFGGPERACRARLRYAKGAAQQACKPS